MKVPGWVVLIPFIAILLYRSGCQTEQQTRQDVIQKQAIAQADTARAVVAKALPRARARTDVAKRLIVDPVIKATVDTAIQAERDTVDAVIAAADSQIALRNVRIETLEKRTGGTLFLFAEAGAAGTLRAPITIRPVGEAGVAIKLDRDTYLQGAVTVQEEVKVTVRKQVRLF